MPDTVHDERLAAAFTRLKSDVREEILPPGTDAVRHTVRRRRSIRVACAAAAVALLAAGAAVVSVAGGADRVVPAVEPTLSQAELQQLAEQAGEVVFPFAAGGWAFAMTAEQQGVTREMRPGSSPQKYLRGDHDLIALCLGQGTVSVAWQEPSGQAGRARAVCDGDTVVTRFTMRRDGGVRITLTADEQAIGRAGIAIAITEAITDPQLSQLRDLALAGRGRLRISGWGVLDGPGIRTQRSGLTAGTYVLRFGCLGEGSVTATLTVGTQTDSTQHPCRRGSAPATVTVTTTAHSAQASVMLTPDRTARQGQTMYAYNLGTG